MSNETRKKRSGRSLTGAVIAGALMVPVTAVAAVALVQAVSTPAVGSDTEFAVSTTVTSIASTTTTTESVLDVVADDPASIEEACTDGAEALLAKEADATLSDIETAALAALREICEEHDMAIPGPVATEVVRVVTVPAPTPTTTAPSSDHADDRYDDDQYDDDRYDEDDDHEDEHDEDEHDEDEHDEDEHHEDDD